MARDRVPAEEAVIISIGVPHQNTHAYVKRAIQVLDQYGFFAGPTSDEALIALGRQKQAERNGRPPTSDT